MPTPQRIISDMKEGLDTLMVKDSEKEGLKRLRSCIYRDVENHVTTVKVLACLPTCLGCLHRKTRSITNECSPGWSVMGSGNGKENIDNIERYTTTRASALARDPSSRP